MRCFTFFKSKSLKFVICFVHSAHLDFDQPHVTSGYYIEKHIPGKQVYACYRYRNGHHLSLSSDSSSYIQGLGHQIDRLIPVVLHLGCVAPQRTFDKVQNTFGCHNWERECITVLRSRMLLNFLQCTGWPFTKKGLPSPKYQQCQC